MGLPFYKELCEKIAKIKSRTDLKAKAGKSSAALAFVNIFERILRIGRIMVLTRLLVPEEFGLIAMVMMSIVMVESITDAGIRLSVIQHKDGADKNYLNAAWWIQFGRGACIFALSAIVAPFIAAFYEKPELTNLLRVSFVVILVSGIVSPRVHLLEREFRFGKWVSLSFLSAVVGTAVTIALAFYLHNVWAVVYGNIIERTSYCIITFLVCPFFPRLPIDRESLKKIIGFAKGILGLSFLNLIAKQADIIVLGKVVSSASLGFYYLALKLAEQPMNFFARIVSPVLLPAFAKKQSEPDSLRQALYSVNRLVSIIVLPLACLVSAYSDPLLAVIYGSQYSVAAQVLSILSITIFFKIQIVVLTQMLFGLGLPHLHRKASFYRSIFIVATIYPAVMIYSVNGAALTILMGNVILLTFQILILKNRLSFTFSKYIRIWGVGLILSIGGFLSVGILKLCDVQSVIYWILTFILMCMLSLFIGIVILRKNAIPK